MDHKIQTEDPISNNSPTVDSIRLENIGSELHTLLLLKNRGHTLKHDVLASITIESLKNLSIKIERNGKLYEAALYNSNQLEPVCKLPKDYYIPDIKVYKTNSNLGGLQIYRDNEKNIAFVDMRPKSLMDIRASIIGDALVVWETHLSVDQPFLRIEHWRSLPSAREVIFGFRGATTEVEILDPHLNCLRDCQQDSIIKEIERIQSEIIAQHIDGRAIDIKKNILPNRLPGKEETIVDIICGTQKLINYNHNYLKNMPIIQKALQNLISYLPEAKRQNRLLTYQDAPFNEINQITCNVVLNNKWCLFIEEEYLFWKIIHTKTKANFAPCKNNENFMWKIEMYNATNFYIKNVENGEYLHQSESNDILVVSKEARNKNNQWTFPLSDPCNHFRIKNSATGMYLETLMKDFLDSSNSSGIFSLENCLNLRDGVRTKRSYPPSRVIEEMYIPRNSANIISFPINDFTTWARKSTHNLFIPIDYFNEYGRVVAHDLCSKLESNLDEYKGKNVSKCEESIFNTAKSLPNPEEFMNVLSKDVNHRLEVNYACEKKYSSIEGEKDALQNVNHRREYLSSCQKQEVLTRRMLNNKIYNALNNAEFYDKAFNMVDGNIMLINLFLTLFQKAKDEKVVESKFEELSEYHELYSEVVNKIEIKTEMTKLIENNYNVTINIAKEDLYDSNLVFSFLFGTKKEISYDLLTWLKNLIHSKELTEIKQLVDSRNFNELIKPIVKKISRASENNKFVPEISRISLEFKKACRKIVKEISQASISQDDIYNSYRLDFISLVTQGISAKEITNDLLKKVDLLVNNIQSEEKGLFNKIKNVLLAILPTPGGIIEGNKRQEDWEPLKIRIESIVSEVINSSMGSAVNHYRNLNNSLSTANSSLDPTLSPFTLAKEPSLISNATELLPSPVFNQISVEPVVNNTTMIS